MKWYNLPFCVIIGLLAITWPCQGNPGTQAPVKTPKPVPYQEYRVSSSSRSLLLAPLPKVPETVDEAVVDLFQSLSQEDKDNIRKMTRDDLGHLHFGLGGLIRKRFGLWGSNKVLLKATKKGHPDDAAMVIIERFWEKLNKP